MAKHLLLSQVEPVILERGELKEHLQKLAEERQALAALPGKYEAAHAKWKAEARALPAGAPMPLEPASQPPYDVVESAKLRIRWAEEALTDAVAESRDALIDVVKAEQAELFEEVKAMIARMREIVPELHGLARSARWVDEQSPEHPYGRDQHLILTLEPADLVKAVEKGSTFIGNKTGHF